jgi:glycosyltransferase involved in cell wall biosynthesis
MRVSVVIPCYNSARFLAETVDSVFEQALVDCELLLIDDGSSDGTVDLIRSLTERAPIPTRGARQANAGVASARNTGFAMAQGEFVVPLDADDLLAPGFLAAALAEAERTGVDIVYPDRLEFGDVERLCVAGAFDLERLKRFNRLSYCALIRRALWSSLGGYRPNVSGFDDWDFWIGAAANGARAAHLDGFPFRHRRHRQSQIHTVRAQYDRLYAQIILNHPTVFATETARALAVLSGHGDFRAERWLFDTHYMDLR